MAKLQRKSAKLFAEDAAAAAGGIAQFGSLAEGTPNYSTDPDVIQALDAYKEGWSSAVLGRKSPALEDRNALDYLLSYQQAYIMQHGIPEWLDTETYYEHSFVVDSNGDLRVSLIDNNTGNDPAGDSGNLYWGYSSGSIGHQIGEVYYSQSSLVTDNPGSLPLFTGEVIASADTVYPHFYAWVLSHTELCKTQAQYDTAISTYGECPYYVIDTTNKTIRLPKLANYVKMANTTEGITQKAAGLPQHTHSYTHANIPGGGQYQGAGVQFAGPAQMVDATTGTASNAIYGNSNTVTPVHTTLYPWVCVFNAAVPASTAQAASFQSALTGKADTDLANVTAVGTSYSAGWAMPSSTKEAITVGASEAQYQAPANGWFSFVTTNTATQVNYTYLRNETTHIGSYATANPGVVAIGSIEVKKGDYVSLGYYSSTISEFYFVYAEGSKSEA